MNVQSKPQGSFFVRGTIALLALISITVEWSKDQIIWNIIKVTDRHRIGRLYLPTLQNSQNCFNLWVKDEPCRSSSRNFILRYYYQQTHRILITSTFITFDYFAILGRCRVISIICLQYIMFQFNFNVEPLTNKFKFRFFSWAPHCCSLLPSLSRGRESLLPGFGFYIRDVPFMVWVLLVQNLALVP